MIVQRRPDLLTSSAGYIVLNYCRTLPLHIYIYSIFFKHIRENDSHWQANVRILPIFYYIAYLSTLHRLRIISFLENEIFVMIIKFRKLMLIRYSIESML